MVGWTKRQTNKSRPVRCCYRLLWRKRSWTKKQSSPFTGPSTFQTSLMLTEYAYRLQEQDPGYEQLCKMASVIWESWVESLLLCIKTNQLRQFGHLMWTLKKRHLGTFLWGKLRQTVYFLEVLYIFYGLEYLWIREVSLGGRSLVFPPGPVTSETRENEVLEANGWINFCSSLW